MPTNLIPPISLNDQSKGATDSAKLVSALKKACDEAFNYPEAAKSCSHAVWYVIKKLIDVNAPLRKANDLIALMSSSKEWRVVNLEDGWKLANQGVVVIGGKVDSPNGHVIVIYPGSKIPGGGYSYEVKNKITGKITNQLMRSHGVLPRCLSRTLGTWPGGTSKGDKNVFDPWGNDEVFHLVRYWTMHKPQGDKSWL